MYPNALRTLGDHIRARRLDLGLRQKDVATLIQKATQPNGSLLFSRGKHPNKEKIDVASIFNWEKGKAMPSVRFYPAIMQFLGYCPVHYPKTIGERIRLHRIHRGLSISGLANILDVDPCTVGNWERGKKSPLRQSHLYIKKIFRLSF